MNKIIDGIYKYRFIIAIIILIVLVAFKLSGSSTSLWNIFFNKDKDEGILFGNARIIRYDEYVVNTMMAFSQYENNFGFTSNLLRGSNNTNMFIIYGQPVKDIAIIFRLFLVGYLFLSPERGLSFFWWTRMIALFLATFEFAMLITNKNKKLSLIATMLITFAPTVHWWFAVNNLIEMIVFAEIAILLIDKYLNERKFWKKVLFSLSIMLCAGNYMFCTYPAWLIPMTYIFLPSLVWVFYKNRKNIKFTKKDIIVLVFEILVLTGLVFRIIIKSKDALGFILNTVYPGKRISSKGDINCLLNLLTSNMNLFLAYTTRINNPCEESIFIDFLPIMVIMLVYSIIKNKQKDFLLYFMTGVSIFLSIYYIFGFPVWLSKLTLLSYSTANRLKGIIGILNIFILVRLLAITKENIFSEKKSIIFAVLISIILGILAVTRYKEQFYLWQYIITIIFSTLIYFLILQAKDKSCENLLVISISIFAITSIIKINPLTVGTPIFKSEFGNTVKQINSEDPGIWVANGLHGNFLIPFGVNCFNCVNTYPNLPLWYKIDANHENEDIYNRYAYIIIELTKETEPKFELIAQDSFKVYLNIDQLDKINVKYVCSRNLYDENEINTNNHRLVKLDKKENVYIYKIESIGE